MLSQLMRVLIFIFRVCDLWRPEHGSTVTVYTFYSIALLTTSAGIHTLFNRINSFNIPDREEFTIMTLTEVALFVKIVIFHVLKQKLHSILAELSSFALEDNDARKFVEKRLNFYFRIRMLGGFFRND